MIGRTVSHYRVTRQLGAGGMGVVYEAVDTRLDRNVALKFLPAELTGNPEAKARFVREARAASALDHPNVCTIFEIDEAPDGRMFIAMACYAGETLQRRIARGPLEIQEALRIAAQMAAGLGRAHAQGIVHRDTKPANVFLTEDGQVKILDFGVAKLTGRDGLTQPDALVGTVRYMSPEQVRGDEVDARSDIWAVGAVLHEMLTGQPPFRGETPAAVVHAILHGDPEPPSRSRPQVPAVLDGIVATCLEEDPGARYQTLEHFANDLQGLATGSQDAVTLPLTPQVKRGRVARRATTVLGVLLSVAVLALGTRFALERLTAGSGSRPERIAVLPFENLGPQLDTQLCEGMTDVVTARLAGIVGLDVSSRQSVRKFAGSARDAREIGRELEADYLLEGTVQREVAASPTGRLRVTPQLIRVADDTHVWAHSYDLVEDSSFEVQTMIAERVAYELGIELLTPVSEGVVNRAWSRELYAAQAGLAIGKAIRVQGEEPIERALLRGHFDTAVRCMIGAGFLAPGHTDGEDLAHAFAAIFPDLDSPALSSRDIHELYLASRRPVAGSPPRPGTDALESELGLVFAEFGVDVRRTPIPRSLLFDVREAVATFTDERRRFTEGSLRRGRQYLPMIQRQLARENLPAALACLPFLESGYRVDAVSQDGAAGLWQLVPAVARDYGLLVDGGEDDQRLDPYRATVVAVKHLAFLLDVFGANQHLCAVAGFNCGAGTLTRCLHGRQDPSALWRFWDLIEGEATCLAQETKAYVPQFLAAAVIMRRPEAFGLAAE